MREAIKLPYYLCVYNVSPTPERDSLVWNPLNPEKSCNTSNKISWLFPGEKQVFSPVFTSDITKLWYKDHYTHQLNITLSWFKNHFAHEEVRVTVAKPWITVNSGISYIGQWQNDIANINEISNDLGYNTNQTNIQWTLIWDWSNNIGNNGTIWWDIHSNAWSEWNYYATSANINNIAWANWVFKPYNWLDNVYYSNGNTTLDNTIINNINKPTTFIVENGNLTINNNVTSNYNIAFIVKWWNIIINHNVTELKWTYITIGWKINSDWTKTENQLKINGSVYGNMNGLRDYRTHISLDNSTWNIQVGTQINYNSNLLNKPAPLVSKFIWDYIDSIQIAQ